MAKRSENCLDKTIKLTKSAVDRHKPAPDQDFMLWDTEIKGFGLRVRKSGKRSYLLKYRNRSGTIRKPTIGVHGEITCEQAREIAQDWKAEVVKGGDPSAERQDARKAPTLAALCDRYLEEWAAKKKPASQKEDRRLIERLIKPRLGTLKIAEVSYDDVDRLHRSLKATPYQANRVLALLSKAMNLAEKWKYRPLRSNPCMHIDRFKENGRKVYVSLGEFTALGAALTEAEKQYAAAAAKRANGEKLKSGRKGKRDEAAGEDPSTVAAVRLLVFTGARVGEILGLEWTFIDFENACINLKDSKTGEKTIHLNAPALEFLNRLYETKGNNTYVLPGGIPGEHLKTLTKQWYRIRKRAGLDHVRLHDLRHSFASVAVGSGHSLPLIGAMLGHTSTTTTQRYAHLERSPVQTAVESVGASIDAAMKRGRADVVDHPTRNRDHVG